MSIPVFLVEGSGSASNQALVVAAGLVPLGVVLWRRAHAGRWLELSPASCNVGWLAVAGAALNVAASTRAAAGIWTRRALRVLPLLGVFGLLAILIAGDFRSDVPPQPVDRAAAESAADAALKERGVVLSPEWKHASATRVAPDEATAWLWHRFVWREAGPETYRALIGTTLSPPLWEVRYAMFEGDVAGRAEEWRVAINPDGSLRQVRHQLPENRPGARLSREDARNIAQREIVRRFALDPADLREVSVEQQDRPARLDWQFTYADPRVDAGKGGEARVLVGIAGDEVVNAGRYVFVPEEWQRLERDRAGRLGIAKSVVAMAVIVVAIAALIAAIVSWSRGRFDRRAFWLASSMLLAAGIVNTVNQWPLLGMRLSTTEPVTTQIALYVGGTLLAGVFAAMLGGLLSGVASFAARAGACRQASRGLCARRAAAPSSR